MKGSMVTSDGKCTIILIVNAYYCSLDKVKGKTCISNKKIHVRSQQ